jgi:hypothetical protein
MYSIMDAYSSNDGIFRVDYRGGNCMTLYAVSGGYAVLTLEVVDPCNANNILTYTYGIYVESGGGCTGCPIETLPVDAVSVFPNPTSDVINIDLGGGLDSRSGAHLKVYNNYGKLVKNLAIREASVAVPVSDLPEGFYTLNLYNNKKLVQHRIQIVR